MRIGDWLQQARAAGVARLDAQQLLAHHLGRPRTWLLAHEEEALDGGARLRADADLARRATGVPLAYLLGEREFHGLALQVNANVLVPRPETEGLVDWALELAPRAPLPRLADLGTGSGAIALAFKHRAPAFEVCASDQSAAALSTARANARRLQLEVMWLEGDWWEPFGRQSFGIAVSNPPYVAEGDPHLAALRHEPKMALVGGADGLLALRRVVAGAPTHLAAGGWLLLEHGFDQASAVANLLAAAGFEQVSTRADLAGQPRLTGGRRRPG
ncbi:MAG: peptide chain release factor N(5)-glutamine methyltransferase [Rubrivivax sp.]|nr:peptide chain release factor N(5)-glutamine methyltransferase [Rubrivivax sp.]